MKKLGFIKNSMMTSAVALSVFASPLSAIESGEVRTFFQGQPVSEAILSTLTPLLNEQWNAFTTLVNKYTKSYAPNDHAYIARTFVNLLTKHGIAALTDSNFQNRLAKFMSKASNIDERAKMLQAISGVKDLNQLLFVFNKLPFEKMDHETCVQAIVIIDGLPEGVLNLTSFKAIFENPKIAALPVDEQINFLGYMFGGGGNPSTLRTPEFPALVFSLCEEITDLQKIGTIGSSLADVPLQQLLNPVFQHIIKSFLSAAIDEKGTVDEEAFERATTMIYRLAPAEPHSLATVRDALGSNLYKEIVDIIEDLYKKLTNLRIINVFSFLPDEIHRLFPYLDPDVAGEELTKTLATTLTPEELESTLAAFKALSQLPESSFERMRVSIPSAAGVIQHPDAKENLKAEIMGYSLDTETQEKLVSSMHLLFKVYQTSPQTFSKAMDLASFHKSTTVREEMINIIKTSVSQEALRNAAIESVYLLAGQKNIKEMVALLDEERKALLERRTPTPVAQKWDEASAETNARFLSLAPAPVPVESAAEAPRAGAGASASAVDTTATPNPRHALGGRNKNRIQYNNNLEDEI